MAISEGWRTGASTRVRLGSLYTLVKIVGSLPDKSAEKPDEGLFELIVRLGRDVVVLKILLSVENNLLGLNFAVLNVDLVSNENDGDVLADSDEILVPLGHILVGDAGAHIKHDDSAISANTK